MSVTLVAIRIEVDEGHSLLPLLHFNSEKCSTDVSMNERSDTPKMEIVASGEDDAAKIGACRGRRKSTDIEVHSFTNEKTAATSLSDGDSPRQRSVTSPDGHPPSSDGSPLSARSTSMSFFFGNPMIECTRGILHLYKEKHLTSLDANCPRSSMIALVAVPAKFALADLQQFMAPARDVINQIKIIRDSTPNQYMVLLKFLNQMEADSFYKQFNGLPYNSLEPEVCQLVYVAKVESMKSSQGASFPISLLTELPTCPVCLERMDESVEGILTILCNHSFHADCLGKWSDSSCPVCRHTQTPVATTDQKCFECDSKESLWICLICGYIGCGRYQERHAYEHFKLTAHTFSMELESQRVWDYAGDNYVHRLIQSKSDGKMVVMDGRNECCIDEEKIDSLNLEYSYLLTNQLESQRLYFEEKMMVLEKESHARISAVEDRLVHTTDDYRHVQDNLTASQREGKQLEKKYQQIVSRVGALCAELKEERELNRCLRDNQAVWQDKFNQLTVKYEALKSTSDKEVTELKEDIHDLMKHLEMQSAIDNAESGVKQDIQGGNLLPLDEPSQQTARHKTKGRKK